MKRILIIVTVAVLVIALCSCTPYTREDIEPAEDEVTEEAAEPEEEPAEEPEEEEPERDAEGYRILADGIKEKGGWYYLTDGSFTFGDILKNSEYYYFEVTEGEGWLWFDSWEEKEDEFDEYGDMLFLTEGQYITLCPEENDVVNIFAYDHEKGFTVKCF